MNSSRSYLDAMNAGRRRRPSTSLEQLSQTLDELESRIGLASPQRGSAAPYHDDTPRAAAWSAPREDRRIAEELRALREELRHEMGAGLRREFSGLKGEIERALQSSGAAGQAAELGTEFERLSAMIHKLAERSDDRQVNLLRLEMEEVKNSLGKLAREDTVQSFDRRWDEFDRRWSDIASKVSAAVGRDAAADGALAVLTERLEQIGDAINALPTSVALRSLEDRMKMLSSTVDQFAHHQDRVGSEALDTIGERLNEISRAIAASTAAARPAAFDPEPFERIEARISSLARQIGDAADENPTGVLFDQLAALSHRVEDLAHRVDVPQHTVARLGEQIETIAGRLDRAPAAPDLESVFRNLENRFVTLSSMLEQRHEDALSQGQSLFNDLERRLDEVAARIRAGARPDDGEEGLLRAMDARFADFASRFEQKPAPVADDRAIRALEARLETISSRMDASARDGVDPGLIRGLESQIAGLAAHLSQPAAAHDISPRLDQIERSIAESRQDVIEAARRAAEEAVRSFSGLPGESAHVAGLAEDLKSLEALTRRSDDRNAKTFEAIHDTLLKIVERLGALETTRAHARDTLTQTPPMDLSESLPLPEPAGHRDPAAIEPAKPRSAATAAAEAAAEAVREDGGAAAKRSMLGGLTRAFSVRKLKPEEPAQAAPAPAMPAASQLDYATPTIELDEPLDPQVVNQPLEPGSGAPDLNAIMKRVRDERGQPARGPEADTAKSDFIAAARRAAQAAAAEAEMMKRGPTAKGKSQGFSLVRMFGSKRKMVLMGVGAVLLALAALQGGRMLMARSELAEAPATGGTAVVSHRAAPATPPQTETATTDVAAEPVRVIGEDTPPATARSMMASVPENAAEVTTGWLDSTATATTPATLPAGDDIAEVETPAVADEVTLASIPVTAGPVALREAAAAGDPKALYEIGNRHAEGRGVAEDMAAAAEWYEKAAEQGLAPAQYRIGNLYEKGAGVARDVAKAKTWYQLAAAQGNASAMHNLAVLYAMGADGVTDNDTAARWFTQAAELGVRDSQYNLGILAAKGVGMQQDLGEAYKWFALVAKAGDKDAAEKRDEVARALSPEQLEKARAATELWRAKAPDEEANTVEIPESWSESAEMTATIDIRQAVRNIQQILNSNGYDAGGEDGLMGQRTQKAIAAFQKDNGMEPTGEVDEKLVRALLERR